LEINGLLSVIPVGHFDMATWRTEKRLGMHLPFAQAGVFGSLRHLCYIFEGAGLFSPAQTARKSPRCAVYFQSMDA
jgi:hypothetical protein